MRGFVLNLRREQFRMRALLAFNYAFVSRR
jgi:hypothetical protein